MTTWLNAPFQTRFRVIDGLTVRFARSEDRPEQALLLSPWPDPRQIVASALAAIGRYALPDAVREDYFYSGQGDRFVEAMRYVRTYPAELPILRDLLPEIRTPGEFVADTWSDGVQRGRGGEAGCASNTLALCTEQQGAL